MYDAVVVGSGPNGLAAAAVLGREGYSVLVVEAASSPGGGTRTEELTLPGYLHDVCSAVHPLAVASPLFRSLELEKHGVTWCHAKAPLAHVLDDERALTLERSVAETAAQLGRDRARYEDLVTPLVERFDDLVEMFVGPLQFPRRPLLGLRFARNALLSMKCLAQRFEAPEARALLAGAAAHSMLPLDVAGTAAFALILAVSGHAVGWPVAEGGSHSIARALLAQIDGFGGEVWLDHRVRSRGDLPPARVYLFDVTPRQLLAIDDGWLPDSYRKRLARYRYGPGVFKIDWALDGPVPWRNPACRRATTIHLWGQAGQMHAAESAPHDGRVAEQPFVLFVQPTLADPSRAPWGKHTGWAYCHVPAFSHHDITARIEAMVERFAPGFRDLILARHTRNAAQMEEYNPNFVGGDINGGAATLDQLFFRPVVSLDPYSTPNPRVFLCSSATPPGGGVHGLCGSFAAKSALRRLRGSHEPPRLLG
ncbi:MAG: FAD-dependent oxidoreductase [Sorangiineae bacterium NIC37A_2]|jgi:phytoene dehydrogenase-like protein|nr:MAG: FAD-dependent oxidoreductase [Sorangiineae bacterium NIC37A_2]